MIITDEATLKIPSIPFDFSNPPEDPQALAAELVKEMVDANGLGLSAVQLGKHLRVFVMRAYPQNIPIFNPKIVDSSDETDTQDEGCLSFPNLVCKVKRPFQVRVRYQRVDGEFETVLWKGLTARVAQHEIDHLDGILFFKRANRFHREQAFRRRNKIIRALKRV